MRRFWIRLNRPEVGRAAFGKSSIVKRTLFIPVDSGSSSALMLLG
jgi:hypothetical protein